MQGGLLRIADRSAQADETEVVEGISSPSLQLTRPEVTTLALQTQPPESDLFIAMAQAMGLDLQSFGDASGGALPGLLA